MEYITEGPNLCFFSSIVAKIFVNLHNPPYRAPASKLLNMGSHDLSPLVLDLFCCWGGVLIRYAKIPIKNYLIVLDFLKQI